MTTQMESSAFPVECLLPGAEPALTRYCEERDQAPRPSIAPGEDDALILEELAFQGLSPMAARRELKRERHRHDWMAQRAQASEELRRISDEEHRHEMTTGGVRAVSEDLMALWVRSGWRRALPWVASASGVAAAVLLYAAFRGWDLSIPWRVLLVAIVVLAALASITTWRRTRAARDPRSQAGRIDQSLAAIELDRVFSSPAFRTPALASLTRTLGVSRMAAESMETVEAEFREALDEAYWTYRALVEDVVRHSPHDARAVAHLDRLREVERGFGHGPEFRADGTATLVPDESLRRPSRSASPLSMRAVASASCGLLVLATSALVIGVPAGLITAASCRVAPPEARIAQCEDLTDLRADGATLAGATLERRDLSGSTLREADLSQARMSRVRLEDADLTSARLPDSDLSEANLRDATLASAQLPGTDLTRADLTGVDLTGADLSGADLTRADLTNANLAGADLRNANLTGAVLDGADLTGARVEGADLREIRAVGADLTGLALATSQVQRGNFSDAILEGADLSGSNLTGVDFTNASLRNADLDDSSLPQGNLMGADLTGATLRGLALEGAQLDGVSLARLVDAGADLTGADLVDTDVTGLSGAAANLATLILDGIDLSGLDLRGTDLTGASLVGANLAGSDLRGASMEAAILTRANLQLADISEADLRESRLSAANLIQVRALQADLQGADLAGARLAGADFSRSNLTGARGLGPSAARAQWRGAICPDGRRAEICR